MAEYIERAAAIKALGERPLNWDDKPDEVQAVWDYDLHRRAILSVSAADVAPVVHGQWVEYKRAHYFKCSECKETVPYRKAMLLNGERKYNFCPNCGAKMDGGNDSGKAD